MCNRCAIHGTKGSKLHAHHKLFILFEVRGVDCVVREAPPTQTAELVVEFEDEEYCTRYSFNTLATFIASLEFTAKPRHARPKGMLRFIVKGTPAFVQAGRGDGAVLTITFLKGKTQIHRQCYDLAEFFAVIEFQRMPRAL
jgi:hypothetical protein